MTTNGPTDYLVDLQSSVEKCAQEIRLLRILKSPSNLVVSSCSNIQAANHRLGVYLFNQASEVRIARIFYPHVKWDLLQNVSRD